MGFVQVRDWINFVAELYICWILTHEFYYDKKIYEQKRKRVKRTKDKVVVSIEDGQIIIKEKPSHINVVTENKN